MTNKYNIGEPVCVYGWVHAVRDDNNDKLVYNITVKDENSVTIRYMTDIPEEYITTVF